MPKFRPPYDRVLVKRRETDAKSDGGIIIPDTAREKPIEGKVVAIGRGQVLEYTDRDERRRRLIGVRTNHRLTRSKPVDDWIQDIRSIEVPSVATTRSASL